MHHQTHKKETPKIRFSASGFILIEAIVAITVLMLAVPAALTIASKSLFLAGYSKDQIIAVYLAQEGIEIIRNKRDENMIADPTGATWMLGITPSTPGQEYRVNAVGSPEIQACVIVGCSFVLKLDPVTGVYSHISGNPTQFSRAIRIAAVARNPGEIAVTATVSYATHGISKTISITENLTSWIH